MQGTQWDTGGQSSTYTHRGGDDEAGTEGGQPIINGLLEQRVLRAQELYERSHGLQ